MKRNRSLAGGQLAMAAGVLGSMGLGTTTYAGTAENNPEPCVAVPGGFMGHPCPQPRPGPSEQIFNADGSVIVNTPEGNFLPKDPFAEPPGSNFLFNVNENLRDFLGEEMPNTLPSTPNNPYNLHDGPVLTKKINPTNPEDDLDEIIDSIEKAAQAGGRGVSKRSIKFALNILEGNKIPNRAYSGFPMLHYNGPGKIKKVEPICERKGKPKKNCQPGDTVIGGNVDVNLIYFSQHIEGDTAMVDPSAVQDVPWTITYHVNILNRGMEDFSPMVMNFDRVPDPVTGEPVRGPFHASMDQSFFPMLEEGTRYTVKIKKNKGRYYNLTYTWGWRIHPPRVQVIENALKTAPVPNTDPVVLRTLADWERAVFCKQPAGASPENVTGCNPMASTQNKLYAISQIGDLSPAKRMWNLFRALEQQGNAIDLTQVAADLRQAFLDWTDRTKLPTGVEADPDATLTLLYVNNTLYGSRQGLQGVGSGQGPASYKGISNGAAHDWNMRPYQFNVTLLNGDHYLHGYMNVDFGGSRGWENHFQYTDPTTADALLPHPETEPPFSNPENIIALEEKIFPINRGGTEEFLQPTPRNPDDPVNGAPQLGSGCFFTFGRNHAWPNAGGPWGGIGVMPVQKDGTPSMRKVTINYNFEPSRRLKIYQFDPLHHDVSIYSLH